MSVELKSVTKTFLGREGRGRVVAVDNVSLTIEDGEFVTLLGPSGCGKTTTLRLIAGFELPTEGRIILDGTDITTRPPNRRDMAMVFQSYALFPHMSVFNNVAYGLQVRRLPRADIRKRVNEVLTQVGLTTLGNRRPNELSGGQQQRVALARALVMEPRVLLFDEPLSNLDAKLRVQMRSEIRRLQQRLNITTIYVTHDQVEAMAMSDRIVIMNSGRVEQIGKPEEIYRHPRTRFVADFIGRANFIQTEADSIAGSEATVRLLGQTVSVPILDSAIPSKKLTAVLRPEGLKLRRDTSLQQVRIEQVMYLGSEVEYLVETNGQTIIVVDTDPRAEEIFNEGEQVGIDFFPNTVHLLPEEVA
ncbi:MAG: ABC transporter ATP-binding protein [Anaerolineae bacterium]|nr:ABC transporter ATP-binding protein [Anaerolineae bacterium]